VLGTVILVFCLILFREKPETPPSSTEASETSKVWQNIKKVLKDRNAILLIASFGLILGVMNTYGTIIGIISSDLGYTEANASLFGAVFIVGGIFGSGVFGGLVEVKKNYKQATVIICWLTFVTPLPMYFALPTKLVWAVALSVFWIGFSSVSILPVGIDFGVELTHPIAESISSGLLMSSGQFFGIILTISGSVLITNYGN